MKNETIIILSHVGFDNTPYCSYVHSHAKALKQMGYNVIVFAAVRWFPFISKIKKDRKQHYEEKKGEKIIDGIKVIYFKSLSISNICNNCRFNFNGMFYYYGVRKKIEKIIQKENVVLIDAHTFRVEGYVASKLKNRYTNIPSIVTCHGTSFLSTFNSEKGKDKIKRIANKLDCLVCVSEKFQKMLTSIGVMNTKVIYNGINYYKMSEKIEQEKNINYLITLGTLKKRKNIDLVIKAFEEIHRKYKDTKLIIIGEGVLRNQLVNECKELRIEEDVKFEGRISNKKVYELMKKSNIFILPSVDEGFGICYAEAMYNGCIAIGTKGEGIDGFIIDNYNGFLVNPSVEEIVKKINYIFEHKEETEIIRKRGKEIAKTLSWDKNASSYIEFIKK